MFSEIFPLLASIPYMQATNSFYCWVGVCQEVLAVNLLEDAPTQFQSLIGELQTYF